MKKIIIPVLGIIIGITESTFGATMCVKNDTISVALDPSIAGTNYSYNTAQSTWWTWFPYGTVRGISACLSSAYGKSFAGLYTAGVLTDYNRETQTSEQATPVVGGERNGQYCWCRMTHPAVSLWAFGNTAGSASVCASNCSYYCGSNVRTNSSLRSALFGSVAN